MIYQIPTGNNKPTKTALCNVAVVYISYLTHASCLMLSFPHKEEIGRGFYVTSQKGVKAVLTNTVSIGSTFKKTMGRCCEKNKG